MRVFYEDAFLLSSDFIIINDKVAYNIAFKLTGEMNDALNLVKLSDVCGDDCCRVVLSGIHWRRIACRTEILPSGIQETQNKPCLLIGVTRESPE